MAKMSKNTAGVFALEFLSSLVYIGVAFTGASAFTASLAGQMGIWYPVFFAVGAISAVALFFLSLGGMAWGWTDKIMHLSNKAVYLGGIALAALTFANTTYLWTTLLGFVLGIVGIMYYDK